MRCFGVLAVAALFFAPPRPAAPALGVSGDRFTVNGSPRFLLFVSYFDAMRRAKAGDVDTDFRYIRNRGFDGIRIFPNWYHYASGARADDDALFTSRGEIRQRAWALFAQVLDRAAASGLIVDVSFSRETVSNLSVDNYITQLEIVASRLEGQYGNVLFDLQNEFPVHMSNADAAKALAAVRAADAARIVTVSIDAGSTPDAGKAGRIIAELRLPVAAYHEPRDRHSWFTEAQLSGVMAALRSGMGDTRVPIYLQEPLAVATLCPPRCAHDFDDEPSHARAAAAAAERAGAAAWTFHTRSTFDLATMTFKERLEADAKQRAAFEGFIRSPTSRASSDP